VSGGASTLSVRARSVQMCALPACVRACPPPDLVPPPYAYVVPHLVRAAQTIFKEGQRAGYSSLFIVLQGSARAYRLKTERELAKDKQAKEAREASFRAREAACGCSPSDSPQPGVPRRRQSNASTSPASAHGSNSTSSAPPTPLPANASSPLGSAEAAGGSPPPNASPNPNRPPRPPRFSGEKEEDEPNVTLGQFYVGDHFGASTILFDDGGSNERSVTIEATMALSTLALPRDAFGPLLDRVCLRLRRVLIHRQWLINRGKIELNDLEKGALLGVGGFGRVRLGLHTSGKAFAVKVVDKGKLMESSGLADQMVQERSLLATVNHTFLLRLVTARGSHSARTLHCIRAHTVHARTLRYITAHTVHAPSAASVHSSHCAGCAVRGAGDGASVKAPSLPGHGARVRGRALHAPPIEALCQAGCPGGALLRGVRALRFLVPPSQPRGVPRPQAREPAP
jgi:CRP-like cAMP-binding protein